MPDAVLPKPFSRILLVEGADDFAFFLALLKALKLDETIRVYAYCGKDNLEQGLSNVVQDDRFEDLEHLGIVRDADFNTHAMNSIHSSIDRVTRETDRALAKPIAHMLPMGDSPKVSTFIMPGEGEEGMLEDLVLSAYSEDFVTKCVDDYFTCLVEHGLSLNNNALPKAKVRVFIAGKTVDAEGTGKDRKTWEMRHVYSRDWWSWDSPVFDSVKDYLTQLAG